MLTGEDLFGKLSCHSTKLSKQILLKARGLSFFGSLLIGVAQL